MTAVVLAGAAYWIVLALTLGLLWVLACAAHDLHYRRIEAVRRDAARRTDEAFAAARNDINACLGALPQDMYDRIFVAIVESQDVR